MESGWPQLPERAWTKLSAEFLGGAFEHQLLRVRRNLDSLVPKHPNWFFWGMGAGG